MWYVHVMPHVELKKRGMEIANDWMILFVSIQLMLFTNFIFRIEVQYEIGFFFVFSILFVLVINLFYMIHNISKRI